MNKKGFTLLELLAVIIILAIIAVITAPIMLNVIATARQDAAKDKAWGAIDAVRIAYAQDQSTNETLMGGDNSVVKFSESEPTGKYKMIGETTIKMSGDIPKAGTITINDDGTITCSCLLFGKYYCTTKDGNTMKCESSCEASKK